MWAILESASYMPHGYCLFWQPWLVALYAGSDLLIFLSYAVIPIALLMFLKQRPDIRYRGLVALFAAFILLCGVTHLVSILTLWIPVYPLHGAIKLLTGIISAITAIVLIRLVPRLVAIPAPRQLEDANTRLREEIAAHEVTLEKLRTAHLDLERKIEARTAELTQANRQLSLVTREAVHRGRNLLSIVNSIARHTARGVEDVEAFMDRFTGRVIALSNATSAIMSGKSKASALLETVARQQLEPILLTYQDRITIDGPPVELSTDAAQQIALALHELATNAAKFGAFARQDGSVDLSWSVSDDGPEPELRLLWQEQSESAFGDEGSLRNDGGFGTTLLTTAVPAMLQGSARREINARGLTYELSVPISALSLHPHEEAELAAGLALTDKVWSLPRREGPEPEPV